MTEKEFWERYYGEMMSLNIGVEKKFEEFQKIKNIKANNDNIDMWLAGQVYMESIILDMAKIFGVANSDQTGLKSLKENLKSPQFDQFKKQIEEIEQNYSYVKEKIKKNRNWIISHADFINKYNLKISPDEFERTSYLPDYSERYLYIFGDKERYEKWKNETEKKIVSEQKENQSYAQEDLISDIPLFKKIIEDLYNIFDKICAILLK